MNKLLLFLAPECHESDMPPWQSRDPHCSYGNNYDYEDGFGYGYGNASGNGTISYQGTGYGFRAKGFDDGQGSGASVFGNFRTKPIV